MYTVVVAVGLLVSASVLITLLTTSGVRLWAPNHVKLILVPEVVPLCYSSNLLHSLGIYNFPSPAIMHMYRPQLVALSSVLSYWVVMMPLLPFHCVHSTVREDGIYEKTLGGNGHGGSLALSAGVTTPSFLLRPESEVLVRLAGW